MSTAIHGWPATRISYKEDKSSPNTAYFPAKLHDSARFYNYGLLSQLEAKGRRTIIRISFEVMGHSRAKRADFMRLRQRAIKISCPNPEQAELVMGAIAAFIEQLNGKWLAPLQTSPNPNDINNLPAAASSGPSPPPPKLPSGG